MATGDHTDPGTGPLPEEQPEPDGAPDNSTPDSEHPTDQPTDQPADQPADHLADDLAELRDDDVGRWQVTTRTSLYVLDLTRRTLLRLPGTAEHGVDPRAGNIVWVVTSLPDDHRLQRLVWLERCAVGEVLVVHTQGPRGVTVRTSTPIREIRRLRSSRRGGPAHG